jgi:hypothetical protein
VPLGTTPNYDKDGNPLGTPYKVVLIVNGQRYSYPVDSAVISDTVTKEENYPIPKNINPPYQIRFEGTVYRGDKKTPIHMMGTKEDIYQIYQLPITNSYEIVADDSFVPRPSEEVTKVTIDYEIVNYQKIKK